MSDDTQTQSYTWDNNVAFVAQGANDLSTPLGGENIYKFGPAGNITQIEKHRKDVETDSGVFSYAYDQLGRLTDATNGKGSKQYHYDNLGNRIMSNLKTKAQYYAQAGEKKAGS